MLNFNFEHALGQFSLELGDLRHRPVAKVLTVPAMLEWTHVSFCRQNLE